MVTFVGTQPDFDDVVISLLKLEYSAIGAYRLAVEKLSNLECKTQIAGFLSDHERHVEEIKSYYADKLDLPDSADLIKGTMTKLKVVIGTFTNSDVNILRAMLDNEMDTNVAYERVVAHPGKPQEISTIINVAYEDEKRHKAWLENYIDAYKDV